MGSHVCSPAAPADFLRWNQEPLGTLELNLASNLTICKTLQVYKRKKNGTAK